MRVLLRATLALGALACWAGAAPAQETFYVTVWGAQRPVVKAPRYSHTWATFVHAGPGGVLEHFTISWLPVDGDVHVLRQTPEPGRNFTLHETLALCRQDRMWVWRWGPYRIDPDLWQRAVRQKARLDSGAVLYKAFDDGSPDGSVSNCLHAVSFMTRPPGERLPRVFVAPANWGESGSYWVALTLRPWFLQPCCVEGRVLAALGVDPAAYPENGLRRNPTRNPATRALQAALQARLLPNRVDCRGR